MSGSSPPPASVVVAARDAEGTLGACLESLGGLNYGGELELVVVDDGSRDETGAIAREAEEVKVIRLHRPRGAAAARNAGVLDAGGSLIAFTDSDCIVAPDWLARLVEPLVDPKVAIAAGEILALPAAGAVERYGEVVHDTRAAVEVYRPPYAPAGNWASRRAVLVELGLFDESFRRSQDVDLSYRAVAAGYRIAHAPGAVVRHRNRATLRGLVREGFVHGFHGRRIERKHRALLDSYGHGRLAGPPMSAVAAHLREAARGGDRVGALSAAGFKLGKRAGMEAGAVRERIQDRAALPRPGRGRAS